MPWFSDDEESELSRVILAHNYVRSSNAYRRGSCRVSQGFYARRHETDTVIYESKPESEQYSVAEYVNGWRRSKFFSSGNLESINNRVVVIVWNLESCN